MIAIELQRAWDNTCKVLLGEEMGNLEEYRDYLKKYTDQIEKRKSALSDKGIVISSNRIPKNARVIGLEEVPDYLDKTAGIPFDINSIKDIDSILEAVREKTYYTGNIVLGNSNSAVNCHRCVNTNFALECQDVYDGKYVAFTTSIRNPEHTFGCCFGGDVQFCIKILDPYKTTRCMELFHCNVTTDCYYSASLDDSSNCMFSFNQKNRHYLIGNIPLGKERYAELKAKLVGEIADELKKKKRVPSIIGIITGKGMEVD
ncbi:TPA: hypothetical protein HA238_03670 [Candidatus Micrarchaeota archaeon]|nr:hypothetical protein [Candidatus Micrarchaeota archaeon]